MAQRSAYISFAGHLVRELRQDLTNVTHVGK